MPPAPATATTHGRPGSTEPLPTIVFVHGAWHGGWCWDGWVAQARAEGFPTATPSLPGHDRPGDRRRIWTRVGQYVRAVHRLVEAIDGPVVIVGHSMGGYVTQRVLEHPPANLVGAVLLASVPRRGVAGTVVRMLRDFPVATLRALVTADLYRLVATPRQVRRAFFSTEAGDDVVAEVAARVQSESYLAFPPMLLRWTRPGGPVPVLVVAADGDRVFTVRSERALARAHGAELVVVPGGHDVMLDVHGSRALGAILDWIRRTTTG